MQEYMNILGLRVKDRVTDFIGVATTGSFDLYGCVQCIVTSKEVDKDGHNVQRYFDHKRLEVTDGEPVMEVPDFATKTPGTVAQVVLFSSATKNLTFRAQVTDGRYAIQIPNHDYYNVFVEFGTVAANVLGGKCLAGAMGAWFLENPPEMSWTC